MENKDFRLFSLPLLSTVIVDLEISSSCLEGVDSQMAMISFLEEDRKERRKIIISSFFFLFLQDDEDDNERAKTALIVRPGVHFCIFPILKELNIRRKKSQERKR